MKIIIDPGHGGIDSNGNYTTAPKKMHTFKDGSINYEGQINRLIALEIAEYLDTKGIDYIYTVSPYNATDMPLKERVHIERNTDGETIFLSIHSNASPKHNARGLELFTSKGNTGSDAVAENILQEWSRDFDELKIRKDYSDGDADKEADFYVLRKTKGKAVLLEILFFDNEQDSLLLKSETFRKQIAQSTVNGLLNYINSK